MSIKAIAFDLDGTLVDSLPDLTNACNHIRRHYNLSELAAHDIESFLGDGSIDLIHRVLTGKKDGRDPARIDEALANYRHYYREHLTVHTRPYPQVAETLATLAARGIPLAVITNKPEQHARAILEHFGLDQYLTAIYGGDTLSERKPLPAPLYAAANDMGVETCDMLMVGDSANDVLSGKAAQSPTVLLTYGYGNTATLMQDPATTADYLLDNFQALLDLACK